MEDSNRSANPSLHQVSDPARRVLLRGAAGASAAALLAPAAGALGGCATPTDPAIASLGRRIGFASVPMPASATDTLTVPPGYTASVLYRWGDPVGVPGAMPAFAPDASNSAAEQALQAGMHHDGMHYFAIEGSSRRGLLALNHEYTDDGLLHPQGMAIWGPEQVAKSIAAHGVSIAEVERKAPGNGWQLARASRYARRITAATPCTIAGPAAGHPLLRTNADPGGTRVLGTLNNCAHGVTPWGTYLSCEENFVFYFEGPVRPDTHQRRWGLQAGGGFFRWHEHEKRFDARLEPNEFNRFGWVVEIDPFDPQSTPIKRTALGRAAHEGAATGQTDDGRVVVYMGEDARFEYIYKFVSRDAVRRGGFKANRELLNHGTLYVAKFEADGSGRWLPLVHGQGPLTAAHGFADQGEVLVKTRQASDLLGATKMDRAEWTAIDPINKEIYVTLTNNSQRGASGQPAVDAANPRAYNTMGHILRWREDGDLDATRFAWTHFVLAGDPANARPGARGNIRGDIFGSPDGLWVDPRGVLWIGTDVSPTALGKGDYARLPNNQMLACDPSTAAAEGGPDIRRFLVGPAGSEVTGSVMTPDLRTLFVNIQHPGESPSERADPANPSRISNWPDGGRPRSATVVITKDDGGVIGS
ncbi:PhoX family protein [Rivibacter subsaxonicus]|nr:PhoX family phosphatase [Rivibacter subsaxonicus]